ncbi:MAG: aminoglycoside phosphotransferase family protein [Lachnospiraceae bacterium]|nr:aminoglycoside phosphotransferase family protein [Lachnospiraceae bacterium]
MTDDLSNNIAALFDKCGLDDVCGDIEAVSGGLMHRMYKVSTESDTYAVKCLNPEVMKRPGVLDNYARAEELESILEKEGIPIVPALSFDGKKMIEDGGRYYYIFRWQEGSITDYNVISKQQCYQAGKILGRIHGIDPQNTEPEEPEVSEIDFDAYALEADRKSSIIAELINGNLLLLKEAQDKLNDARRMLPAMSAIDDPDMDPKNIMWHEDKAYVIDLECLERDNPIATCLDLSLQWAGTVNGKYSKENLAGFFEGYLSVYDNGFRSYDELFGITYTWVEWLEYNIRRALGMEGSNGEDIRLGEEEVKNTIERIKYLSDIEEDVRSVLAGLEAPDPQKNKTRC